MSHFFQYLSSFDWIYFIGTIAFTLSGYLVGVAKRLDVLGIMIVALLTAIGGGMIRDILTSNPPAIFYNMSTIYTIIIVLILAWCFKLHQRQKGLMAQVFLVADSIGLVAFSLAGAQIGLNLELNLFGVTALGFVTAMGGGVVRDMMVNEVPFILHKDFYGTVAILMACLLYVSDYFGINGLILQWSLFIFGVTLRLLAHRHDIRLPLAEK